jgi:hypothetical protein
MRLFDKETTSAHKNVIVIVINNCPLCYLLFDSTAAAVEFHHVPTEWDLHGRLSAIDHLQKQPLMGLSKNKALSPFPSPFSRLARICEFGRVRSDQACKDL